MRTLKFKNTTVLVYDSIDELPIVNFNRYTKYLLIDSGIGSDLEDIDVHIERIVKYIKLNPDLAIKEVLNMRQALYLINQGVNAKHLAFAALIYKINGEEINNMSDTSVEEALKQIEDIPHSTVMTMLEEIKKKLEFELILFFPERDSVEQKEAYAKLKERISIQIDGILSETEKTDEVKKIDDYFLLFADPKSFNGADSVEVKHIKEFENACVFISKEIGINAKSMTTLQFMTSFDYLRKNIKQTQNNFVR